MARRALTFALTLVFALQATWLLHAGVDALAPVAAVAAAAPADCCPRACGCPEDVRLRKGCCCISPSGAEPQIPSGSRAFEAQRCSGVEAAILQALTQPAVEAFPRLLFVPAAGTLRFVCVLPEPAVESTPPEKVPIL